MQSPACIPPILEKFGHTPRLARSKHESSSSTQWTPKVVLAWPEFFLDLPTIGLEMAGIGNEGSACPLQCAILAVYRCPCTLGRREARPLPRAVAPKELQARSRHIANPPKVNSSQRRAPKNEPNTMKHFQKRGSSKTIKNGQKRSPSWRRSSSTLRSHRRVHCHQERVTANSNSLGSSTSARRRRAHIQTSRNLESRWCFLDFFETVGGW